MFDECIMDFGEPFKNTKSSLSANFSWYLTWCSDYFYHGFYGFNGSDPLNSWTFELVSKTKTRKTPCVGCKMSLTSHWCCACLKILKQAWIFSVSYIITLQGLWIHRKAINKNKPSYPLNGILLQKNFHMQGKMVYYCLSPWRGWWPSFIWRCWYASDLVVKSSLL